VATQAKCTAATYTTAPLGQASGAFTLTANLAPCPTS